MLTLAILVVHTQIDSVVHDDLLTYRCSDDTLPNADQSIALQLPSVGVDLSMCPINTRLYSIAGDALKIHILAGLSRYVCDCDVLYHVSYLLMRAAYEHDSMN